METKANNNVPSHNHMQLIITKHLLLSQTQIVSSLKGKRTQKLAFSNDTTHSPYTCWVSIVLNGFNINYTKILEFNFENWPVSNTYKSFSQPMLLLNPPNKYSLLWTAAIVAETRGNGIAPLALTFSQTNCSASKYHLFNKFENCNKLQISTYVANYTIMTRNLSIGWERQTLLMAYKL